MTDPKTAALAVWASKKFDGIHVHLEATADSRLSIKVDASGSVDLPGDLDAIVATIGNMFGWGNSTAPSPSSAA